MGKKRLGQHFLFDPTILRRIVEAADISPDDTVIEIGPGHGDLTRRLAKTAGKIIAIELDSHLFERLSSEFKPIPDHLQDTEENDCEDQWRKKIELVHGDALDYRYEDIGPFKVVANIPYYITTPLIFRIMKAQDNLVSMTLTIQKEVAERIVAPPGTKTYGVLSIMVQYRAATEMRFVIPAEAFKPVPKVDSAVVHIVMRKEPAVDVDDEKLFFSLVRTSFSQRRKTIANSLKGFHPEIKHMLSRAGIDPMRRPETLGMEEFASIADLLSGEKG